MKNNIKKGLLFLMVAFAPLLNFAQQLSSIKAIPNESPLDFGNPRSHLTQKNHYFYDYISDFRNGINNFNQIYQYETKDSQGHIIGRKLSRSSENMKISGLDSLVSFLSHFKFTGSQIYPISDKYFYALNLHYGMDADNMIVLFEPVILMPEDENAESTDKQKCTILKTGMYFRFDQNGNFDQTFLTTDFSKYTNNYTSSSSSIYITHDSRRPHPENHKFRQLNTNPHNTITDNDITSTIIPIQQIYLMYVGNGGNFSPDNILNFFYVADNFNNYDSQHNFILQPHIAVSYNHQISLLENSLKIPINKQINPLKMLVRYVNDFTGLGADYTEHCPNSCDEMTINDN